MQRMVKEYGSISLPSLIFNTKTSNACTIATVSIARYHQSQFPAAFADGRRPFQALLVVVVAAAAVAEADGGYGHQT